MLRKIRKMLKRQEGFTLVELMIVVVILGILAGVGIQQYGKVQENARVNANEANIRIITSAVQMYLLMEDEEPSTLTTEDLVTAGYLQAPAPTSPWDEDEDSDYNITITPGESDDEPTKIVVSLPGRP